MWNALIVPSHKRRDAGRLDRVASSLCRGSNPVQSLHRDAHQGTTDTRLGKLDQMIESLETELQDVEETIGDQVKPHCRRVFPTALVTVPLPCVCSHRLRGRDRAFALSLHCLRGVRKCIFLIFPPPLWRKTLSLPCVFPLPSWLKTLPFALRFPIRSLSRVIAPAAYRRTSC